MRVNKTDISQNRISNRLNPNFKQGLTPEIVNYIKSMNKEEYRNITDRLRKKYGMFAHVAASNTIAFCVEKTAEIMTKAGYSLPKVFSYELLENNCYGMYSIDGAVCINSAKKEFLDIEKQEKMEECARCMSSYKGHFLDTYLHEFLHAAHCNHIKDIHGGNEGQQLFFGSMAAYRPDLTIKNPVFEFVKKLFPSSYLDIINKVFENYRYSLLTSDLPEYFAEKNTVIISDKLGENLNIENINGDIALEHKGFPKNWNIKALQKNLKNLKLKDNLNKFVNTVSLYKNREYGERSQEEIVRTLNTLISYFDGEIWNGNINGILAANLDLQSV